MAEAALAALGNTPLRTLLTDQLLVQAVGAVSAFMATAAKHGLADLRAPLEAWDKALLGATWASRGSGRCVPYDARLVAVSSRAVEPLLQLLEAGASLPSPGAGAGDDGSSAMALHCLCTALAACTRERMPAGHKARREALLASGLHRVVCLALQFLGRPEQAVLALDALLAAVSCCGGAAVEVVVAAARQGQGLLGEGADFLRAASMQLASGSFTSPLAEALFQLVSGLRAAKLVTADQLLARCSGLTDAVAGVLLRQEASSTWRAFSPLVLEDVHESCVYSAELEGAALELLNQLMQPSTFSMYDAETLCELAAAQVDDLLALAVVTPTYQHDLRGQLTSLHTYTYTHSYSFGCTYSSQAQAGNVTANDLVGGIQRVQQRLLDLVQAAMVRAAARRQAAARRWCSRGCGWLGAPGSCWPWGCRRTARDDTWWDGHTAKGWLVPWHLQV